MAHKATPESRMLFSIASLLGLWLSDKRRDDNQERPSCRLGSTLDRKICNLPTISTQNEGIVRKVSLVWVIAMNTTKLRWHQTKDGIVAIATGSCRRDDREKRLYQIGLRLIYRCQVPEQKFLLPSKLWRSAPEAAGLVDPPGRCKVGDDNEEAFRDDDVSGWPEGPGPSMADSWPCSHDAARPPAGCPGSRAAQSRQSSRQAPGSSGACRPSQPSASLNGGGGSAVRRRRPRAGWGRSSSRA
jgi:hypothetical protein